MSTRHGFGDHLPADLIARTKPELSLAGISIVKPYESLGALEARWGFAYKTDSPNGNDCERLMGWKMGTVDIKASVGCEPVGPQRYFVVYTAQVAGRDPLRRFTTGRGLCLGDSFDHVVKLYGSRLRSDLRPDGAREITIQWRNGAQLNVSIDKHNRVSWIQLLPQVE